MKLKSAILALLTTVVMLLVSSANAFVVGPSPTITNPTPPPIIPGKWGSPTFGTGASVTWSYVATGISCSFDSVGCTSEALSDFMPTGFESAVNDAFDAWAAVANISFTEVADGGEVFGGIPGADIRLSGHIFDGTGATLAHAFFPPENALGGAGDIHFDTTKTWKLGFGGVGFDIFTVLAHEIGHAIGLGHEETETALMNPFYSEAFTGLQADDIAGAQFIYGPSSVVDEPITITLMLLGLMLMVIRRPQTS
ncbi:MAG: matrixin family metalloprotease [Pseudomonadales bacterium]|nr:matrixin family metalloprotease [Pseudomonadales bacterium]